MSGCYPNSCNVGNGYNPCGSSCYPNTSYLCAPPQPCRQTVFRSGGSGVTINMSGAFAPGLDYSCTDSSTIQINGSGLSIVSRCVEIGIDPDFKQDGPGHWQTYVAGVIGSCPTNFTTSILINKYGGFWDGGDDPDVSALGCINLCVCGSNVCGSGTITGDLFSISDSGVPLMSLIKGTVQISGTARSACGTRTICINTITITS